MEKVKHEDIINKLESEVKMLTEKSQIQESEKTKQLQLLLSSIIEIPDDTIIYAVDKNLNYLAFNNNYKQHIKTIINEEVAEGQNIISALKNLRISEKLERDLYRALSGEEFFQIGDYLNGAQKFYFKDIYRPLKDNNNNIIGVIVYYTNITETTRSEKTWKILLEIYEKVHQVENIEELIGFIHAQLSKLIDTTNFYVALYDEKNEHYTFPYYIDKYDEINKIEPKSLKKSLTDYVRRKGLPLLLTEFIDSQLIKSGEVEMVGTPSPSWLGVPLKIADKALGVLVVQNYRMKGVFTEKDLDLMAFVSEHIAMALERKRFEQELTQNAADLKVAKEKAEESDKLKSAFLANMSHEIRTPLNAIMGFSKLLAKHNLSKNQREEYFTYIENSGNNLLNLINDIIDVAKIEAGQVLIKNEECKLNQVLDEIFNNFNAQKINKDKAHIEIKLNKANENRNFTVIVDTHRFRQIISNLISNSLKFIENGHIDFGYSYKDKNSLLFYVEDTGIGIPEDKMDIIFNRFGQIVGSEIRNPGGTGLGLSITKHLIEEMGGEIWFESQFGKGTTFFFTLPFEEIIQTNKAIEEIIEEDEKFDFSNLNILVVEDDIVNTTLLTDTLKLYEPKLRIDTASDGQQAILKIKNKDYDVVIMDIRMPNVNGYEATKIIRTKFQKPKKDVPIIGLSAHAMQDEIERNLKIGMNAFLTKPLVEKDIIHQISLLTKSKKLEVSKIETVEKVHEEKLSTEITEYQYIDLTLLTEMYRGDQKKMNNILKLCKQNIPKQINDIENFFKTEKWEQLRITSHSLKSTFNYIGLTELQKMAKSIEENSAKKTNQNEISEHISQIKKIWLFAEEEVAHALQN